MSPSKVELTAKPGGHEIIMTRLIDAPIEEVSIPTAPSIPSKGFFTLSKRPSGLSVRSNTAACPATYRSNASPWRM